MRGLVTRCVSKSKRRWVIQAPYVAGGKKGWTAIGIITEEAPNRYWWRFEGHAGKEPSLNHAHMALDSAYVVLEVTRRLET